MVNNTNGNENAATKIIVISERDNIAGLIEGGRAVEFFIHRGDMLLGDVYLATVENILPSIDAAFVNLGGDRMGFLHASDVPGKGDLKDRLEPKQKLLVQIMKEPTGHKGPRVSTSLTLPGRFLVLMPEEKGISVSRKILSPKERSRIKSIVSLLKPPGVGVIIRTEAESQTEDEIKEDMETLLEKWHNIVSTADVVSPPTLIHRDQDLLYRVIREACTEEVKEIFIDSPFGQHRVNQLLQTWNMGKNIKVNVYKGPESLIVAKGLDKEIKSALNSKVNLPSGGYLYVQPTEALTVIDVNSGRFTSSQTQGETIRKTNLESVEEIARQLRLRNVGGMIVVDFIDMDNRIDQLAILEAFELALAPDKSKPQVGQLSDLGLVELTRHRQGQSLAEIFTKKCPACGGIGAIIEDLNFAPPSLEPDLRSRMQKARPGVRVKPATSPLKQDKPQEMKPSKPVSPQQQVVKPSSTPQQVVKPSATVVRPKPPIPKVSTQNIPVKKPEVTPQKKVETHEVPVEPIDSGYSKQETYDKIEDLNINKLRKVMVEKKFYPEISKLVRYAGVPLRYAKEHFGEDVNMVDVFTILCEMEAAFAKASSTIEPSQQIEKVVEMVEEPAPEYDSLKPVFEATDQVEAEEGQFKGRYGISTEGEDFDQFYEVIENGSPTEKVEDLNKNDKLETSESLQDESEDASEEAESSTSPKAPLKKGRKSIKTTSPRKKGARGRPKTK